MRHLCPQCLCAADAENENRKDIELRVEDVFLSPVLAETRSMTKYIYLWRRQTFRTALSLSFQIFVDGHLLSGMRRSQTDPNDEIPQSSMEVSVARIDAPRPSLSLKSPILLECRVCGAPAHGFNFDQISCDSCKTFFRRNALRPMVSDSPTPIEVDLLSLSLSLSLIVVSLDVPFLRLLSDHR